MDQLCFACPGIPAKYHLQGHALATQDKCNSDLRRTHLSSPLRVAAFPIPSPSLTTVSLNTNDLRLSLSNHEKFNCSSFRFVDGVTGWEKSLAFVLHTHAIGQTSKPDPLTRFRIGFRVRTHDLQDRAACNADLAKRNWIQVGLVSGANSHPPKLDLGR